MSRIIINVYDTVLKAAKLDPGTPRQTVVLGPDLKPKAVEVPGPPKPRCQVELITTRELVHHKITGEIFVRPHKNSSSTRTLPLIPIWGENGLRAIFDANDSDIRFELVNS